MKQPKKKFLIRVDANSKCVKRSEFKKGKSAFALVQSVSSAGIVIDSRPKREDGIITLDQFSIIGSPVIDEDHSVIYSGKVSPAVKSRISDELTEYGDILSDIEGFEPSEPILQIAGPCMLYEVEEHKISLFTPSCEYCVLEIDSKEFKQFKEQGLPYDKFEELQDNTVVSGPICIDSVTMLLDDNESEECSSIVNESYNKSLARVQKEKNKKPVNKKSETYAVVLQRNIKRAWYSQTIYGDFEAEKLSAEVELEFIEPINEWVETFNVYYDGHLLELDHDHGSNYEDSYLVDKHGKRFEYELLEGEDADESDDAD